MDGPRVPLVWTVATQIVFPDLYPSRIVGVVSPTLEVPEEIVMWERFIVRRRARVGHGLRMINTPVQNRDGYELLGGERPLGFGIRSIQGDDHGHGIGST